MELKITTISDINTSTLLHANNATVQTISGARSNVSINTNYYLVEESKMLLN